MTFFVVVAAAVLINLAFYKRVFRATHVEGHKAGLRQAIEIAKNRGDVAVALAPNGKLMLGPASAHVCHTIELELRAALQEVGNVL